MTLPYVKVPEQLRGLAKIAKKAHWTIERLGNQHLLWSSPQGERFVTSSSPGKRSEKMIVKAALRRAGLDV